MAFCSEERQKYISDVHFILQNLVFQKIRKSIFYSFCHYNKTELISLEIYFRFLNHDHFVIVDLIYLTRKKNQSNEGTVKEEFQLLITKIDFSRIDGLQETIFTIIALSYAYRILIVWINRLLSIQSKRIVCSYCHCRNVR